MGKDNLITAFITGGLTVAGTTYITQYLSPELGDIFWSFPLTLLPAIYFLFESGDSANKIAISSSSGAPTQCSYCYPFW